MKNIAYYNGTVGLIEEIHIPMNDRVVYFGDGVYEAAYVRNHRIFAINDHLDRFYRSASLISIDLKIARDKLQEILQSLVDRIESGGEAVLYWQLSRGTAPRSHIFPNPPAEPNLLAYVKPYSTEPMNKKIKLLSVEDERFFFCHIKTLNLLPNVLASQKAAEAGCEEAVFHRGETVTEGSHSNISILKNGTLRTAPLSKYILPGTVRKQLLEYCRTAGIPVDETSFSLDELRNADEIIVTSSTSLIRSAGILDGQPVGGKAQELFDKISGAYAARLDDEVGPLR
ncbi:aminotransferase class IV [Treponema sp. OttesenSCG-928-L16]|nr:aminotransferase class IV [Treponema sp. OttesenSCG-928-L16]